MSTIRWRFGMPGMWVGVALALALNSADGRARGVPAAPTDTLERAAALVRAGAFDEAAAMLRRYLAVAPADRGAREMLAFALESLGDFEAERHVRSRLAAEFPDDPRIQADYGRILERSAEDGDALRAYRRARELEADGPAPDLEAAIERMRGRTALEVGTPLLFMSDPDAHSTRARAGAAIPLGSRSRLVILGSHYTARARGGPAATAAGLVSGSAVLRRGAGGHVALGTHVHVVSPRGVSSRDVGIGGSIAGRAPLGRSFEAEGRAELETPWDEAPVTVLHGGRTSGAEARLYLHGFSRRLLLQAGARSRRMSIFGGDSPGRASARQTLGVAGADVVLWRRPAAALRGEMLDEQLTATSAFSSAVTLAYRRYDVTTRPTPEFAAGIAIAPRGSVDEASLAATLASREGHLGVEFRAGLAHDSRRPARTWSAGGALHWAPLPPIRLVLGYDEATEVTAGLTGRRKTGWATLHVDV